jgi:hypothetical protein
MRPFSITRLGSNQVNQQQTNSLTLCQILEKCNEFNITTHHLFKDFKAAYDTIIRNEVYVGMSELNFPTKWIRLTKATLNIVTCCVKIQNECSVSFETRQGLRQGDVFFTLLFNVVLEVIVRRANQQTIGTIYNKETQLLAYADDIDIVGRSQSAVRDACLAMEGEAAKEGLYLIAARKDTMIRDVGQSVAIGDKHFEVVKEFMY